jgi:hypothetical protein
MTQPYNPLAYTAFQVAAIKNSGQPENAYPLSLELSTYCFPEIEHKPPQVFPA